MKHLAVGATTGILLALSACAGRTEPPDPSTPDADAAWVRSACEPASPETTGWPRYRLGNVSIAVPPEYRAGRQRGFGIQFSRGSATLGVVLARPSQFHTFGYNYPGQVICEADYGGYQTDVFSWHGRGEYRATVRWDQVNEPDERPAVNATIRTTRLRDAQLLLLALHTIRQEQQAPETNPDAWFYAPCLPDSVDSFKWTRYDLHGVRIRVPRDARNVPVPGGDELKFQANRATLRLRLNRDARELFREYDRPLHVYKQCQGDIGGWIAEAISYRWYGDGPYGFAAMWADADRGEYLTAVIQGRTLEDVTILRRALFTIVFPGERRR